MDGEVAKVGEAHKQNIYDRSILGRMDEVMDEVRLRERQAVQTYLDDLIAVSGDGLSTERQLAKIDELGKVAEAKAHRAFNRDISSGMSRDIAQARLDDALDGIRETLERRKMEAAEKFEANVLNRLDTSKQTYYRQMKQEALLESQAKLPRYVPHKVPRETAKALRSKGPTKGAGFTEKTADHLARSLVDDAGLAIYTRAQLDDFVKQLNAGAGVDALVAQGMPRSSAAKLSRAARAIKSFKEQPTLLPWIKKHRQEADIFFSTNPGFLSQTTAENTAQVISAASFRRKIGEGLGKTLDQVMESGVENFDDWRTIKRWQGTKEGKMLFSPEVADELERVAGAYFGDEATKEALNIFDRTQGYWKQTTLFLFAGYHNRNWGSAIYNNALAGVYNPRYYGDAHLVSNADNMARGNLTIRQEAMRFAGLIGPEQAEAYRAANKAKGQAMMGRRLRNGRTVGEVLQGARQNGVAGKRQLIAELGKVGAPKGETIQQVAKAGIKVPVVGAIAETVGPGGVALRAGMDVAGRIEDNVRLALYIKSLDDGMDAWTSARQVAKYQFDYGDITPFERNVVSRAMPFFRFTRFNVPLQLQTALQQPGKIAAVEKVRQQLNASQEMPEFKEALLQDYLANNIPVQLGTRKLADGRELPAMFALGNWLPTQTAMAQLAHPLETLLGLVTPFFKEPLEQMQNYDNFRKKPIVDPSRGRFSETFLNMPIPARLRHVVKNIRLLNEFDRLVSAGIATIDPEKSRFMLRSGYKPELLDQLVSLIGGVKLSPFDATEANVARLNRIKGEFRRLKGAGRLALAKKDVANQDAIKKRMLELRDEAAALLNLHRGGQQ